MNKKSKFYIFLVLIITLSLIIYNTFVINVNTLNIRKEIIKTNKISKDFNNFTIAYFTDLNYGLYTNKEVIAKAIEEINNFDVDLIIYSGSLFEDINNNDIKAEDQEYLKDLFISLKAKYGKYALLNNNEEEKYQNIIAKDILTKSGFRLLNNDSTKIFINKNNYFNLIGINTLEKDEINDIFKNIDNHYNFIVSYYPDTFNYLPLNNCNYVITGYSLGGQIYLPIISNLLSKEGYKDYLKGKYKKDNCFLDINNGIGNKKIKARFLADSEIVIYRFNYQP